MGEYNVRKIRIGENTYNLPSINDEKASAATLYSSEKIEELLKQLKRRSSEIDSVYFTSSTAPNLTSKADGEAFASCEINYNNETITCFATLKVQGNSSASYPKKNFTVKFYSDMSGTTSKKIDVGWGKQSKYCFKANYIDATHARNIVSANIAADMVKSRPDSAFKTKLLECPNLGLVDGFPIKVYMNGLFWGIYTWNMPKDKWTYNMNPNTDILLCSDLHTAATRFESAWDNDVDWELEVGNMPLADVRTKVNLLIDFVANSTDEQFIANLTGETPIVDLYSVIDYYCYCALAYHPDGISKNMLLMSYDNGDTWGLGLYDMDATFCLHWNGLSFYDIDSRGIEMDGSGNLLLKRVRECFGDELLARYNTLRQSALSTSNIFSKIDEISNKLSDNLLSKEHTKWTGIPQANVNTSDKFKEQVFKRSSIVDSRMQLIESDPIIYRLSEPITITKATTSAEYSPASLIDEGQSISRILGDPDTKDYTVFLSFSLSSLWKQYNDIIESRLHSRRLASDIWCFAYHSDDTVGDFALYFSNFVINSGLYLNTKYNLLITYDHTTRNRYFYFDDKLIFTQVIDDSGIDVFVENNPSTFRPLILFSGAYNNNNNQFLTEGTIYDVYFGEGFINSSEEISKIFNRQSESKEFKGVRSYTNTILINEELDNEEANVTDHANRFTTVSKYPFDANDSFVSAELTGDNVNFPGTITATTPEACCIVWNSDYINSSKSPGGYQNLQITTTKNKVLNYPITFCERTVDGPREMVNQDPCLQTDFTLKDDFTIYLDFTFNEHSNSQPYPDLINFRYLKNGTSNYNVSDNLLIPVVFISRGDGTYYSINISGSSYQPYNDTDKYGYVGNAYDWSFPSSSSVGKRIRLVLTKKGMVHKVFCNLDTSGYYMWDNTGKWNVGTDYLSGDSYVANNIGEIYGQGGKIYNWLYSNNVYFYTKAIPDVEAFALMSGDRMIYYN